VSSGRVPVLDAARAGITRLSRPELISDDDAISVSETKKETILEIISFLPWGGDEGIKMGHKRRKAAIGIKEKSLLPLERARECQCLPRCGGVKESRALLGRAAEQVKGPGCLAGRGG